MVCAAFTAGQGAKANGIGYAEEQAPTLRTDGVLPRCFKPRGKEDK